MTSQLELIREDLKEAADLARAYARKRPFDAEARRIFEKLAQAYTNASIQQGVR